MAPRQRISTSQGSSYDDSSSEPLVSADQKTRPRKVSTLNQTESDIARDKHDYFNLVALVFIIVTTGMNYDFKSRLSLESLQSAWTGNYFWLNWATTLTYFLVDLMWVARVPICVKSPGVIIKHHIVAMIYLLGPVCYPEYRWFMGSILSVEVNTWFLILRRVVYKSSGQAAISPLIGQSVSWMFYLTWILIRCIVYPGVMLTFLQLAAERIQETGTYLHLPMIFIPAHAGLCILNLRWTYDLFKPIVIRYMGIGPKPMVVQNGL